MEKPARNRKIQQAEWNNMKLTKESLLLASVFLLAYGAGILLGEWWIRKDEPKSILIVILGQPL